MATPTLFELTFHRHEHTEHPEGFGQRRAGAEASSDAIEIVPQTYLRFEGDKPVARAEFDWSPAMFELLGRLQHDARDADARHRVGAALRAFLTALSWDVPEEALSAAAADAPILLTLQSSAAELYALPWELLTLARQNRHLADLPHVLIRYAWPGTPALPPAVEAEGAELAPRRVVLAWSSAGGRVPHVGQIAALKAAASRARSPGVKVEVVPNLSERALAAALGAGPCTVLHILCHGVMRGVSGALRWTSEDASDEPVDVDADRLARLLLPYRGALRLVVLSACFTGDHRPVNLYVGSLGQAIHRLGIPSVLASRYPLSVKGAIRLTRAFYTALLAEGASLESSLLRARAALHSPGGDLLPGDVDDDLGCCSEDAYALQLYARPLEQVIAEDGASAQRLITATYPIACLAPRRSPARRYNIPELPPHFLGRPEDLARLKALVRSSTARAIGLTGRALRAGLQGMGGIGKSVLAAWLCRDADVSAAFPDGIFWISLGQTPPLKVRQAELSAALGAPGAAFESEEQGKARLTELLANRACLLILDDAWRLDHVTVFGETSPRGRVLITTRDVGILTGLGAAAHRLDVLSDAQSLELLAEWSGQPLEALPAEARSVIQECGNLPLALAMIGATVRGRPDRWENALHKLRTADLAAIRRSFPEYPYPNLLRAIGVSIDDLDPEMRERYLDFAVFPEDTAISEAVLQTLWSPCGLDKYGTEDVLDLLHDRSLLLCDEHGRFRLHDLQRDYIVKFAGEPVVLHGRLLDAYAACCKEGWATGPDDGYFFTHLTHHLKLAGRAEELRPLLLDADWLRAKLKATDSTAMLADFDAVPLEKDRSLKAVQEAIRLSAHVLEGDPEKLSQHLLGRLLGEEGDEIQALSRRLVKKQAGPWLRPLTASLTRPGSSLQRTLVGHPDRVTAVAVTADGRWAVAGSEDRTLKVWDLRSGKELHTLAGHTGNITAVAVSAKGQIAVSASEDKLVKVWDLAAGRDLYTLRGHRAPVYAVAVSADGRRAITGAGDHTLRVWELSTGRQRYELAGHSSGVTAVAMTPDGQLAVSGSLGGTLIVWDLGTGNARHTFEGHQAGVYALAVTADGGRLVSGSTQGELALWDLRTTKKTHTLFGHSGDVIVAAVTADGRLAVSGSDDHTLRVWDLEDGESLRKLVGHLGSVYAVAVTADGLCAISGSHDKTLKLWDLSGGKDVRELPGHAARVRALYVTADGHLAVSGSRDGTLKVWELSTGKELYTLVGHSGEVTAMAVTGDGGLAVTRTAAGELKVWALSRGKALSAFIVKHSTEISSVDLTVDGDLAVSRSKDGKIKVGAPSGQGALPTVARQSLQSRLKYSTETGCELEVFVDGVWRQLIRKLFYGRSLAIWKSDDGALEAVEVGARRELPTLSSHLGEVTSRVLLADGRVAVSGWKGDTCKVWTWSMVDGSTRVSRELIGCVAVAVAPQGLLAISDAEDGGLRVSNVDTGEDLSTRTSQSIKCVALAVTPCGLIAVSTSPDGAVRVWDLDTGKELSASVGVETSAVTRDGRFAISYAANKKLSVRALDTGVELGTLNRHFHERGAAVVVVTDDSRLVLSSSDSGELKLWDIRADADLPLVSRRYLNQRLHGQVSREGVLEISMEGRRYSLKRQYVELPYAVWRSEDDEFMVLETGTSKEEPMPSTLGVITPMVVAPAGRYAISGAGGGLLQGWELGAGEELKQLAQPACECIAVAVAPSGLLTISALEDGMLRMWDVATGEELRTHVTALTRCTTVAVMSDRLLAISAPSGGGIRVWEFGAGRHLPTFHDGGIHGGGASAVTPDGRFIISGSKDNTLKVTDRRLGTVVATFIGESPMTVVAIAPDGRSIVAGDELGGVHFLRLEGI